MGAPSRTSSAYIWLDSRIASLIVAMSDTWLPMEVEQPQLRQKTGVAAGNQKASRVRPTRTWRRPRTSRPTARRASCPAARAPRSRAFDFSRRSDFEASSSSSFAAALQSRRRSRMGSISESFSTTSARASRRRRLRTPRARTTRLCVRYTPQRPRGVESRGVESRVAAVGGRAPRSHDRMTATASRSSACSPPRARTRGARRRRRARGAARRRGNTSPGTRLGTRGGGGVRLREFRRLRVGVVAGPEDSRPPRPRDRDSGRSSKSPPPLRRWRAAARLRGTRCRGTAPPPGRRSPSARGRFRRARTDRSRGGQNREPRRRFRAGGR